jgi:hypothetical protein
LTYQVITHLLLVLYTLFYAPFYTIYLIYRYYTTTTLRPFASWTLLSMLQNRWRVSYNNLIAPIFIPVDSSHVFKPPRDQGIWFDQIAAQGPIKVDIVRIQPVGEEMRIGIAKAGGDIVKGEERGAWMISPWKAKGQRLGKWVEGEKVVLHICGG